MSRPRNVSLCFAALAAFCGLVFAVDLLRAAHAATEGEADLGFVAVHDLGDVDAESVREFDVSFSNRSQRPIRFVGVNNHCTRFMCCGAEGVPFTVPGREERRVKVYVKAGAVPAEIDEDLVFYTDSPHQTRAALKFRFRIVGSQKGEKAASL